MPEFELHWNLSIISVFLIGTTFSMSGISASCSVISDVLSRLDEDRQLGWFLSFAVAGLSQNPQPADIRPFAVIDYCQTMSNLNLQEIHDFAVEIARNAGGMILKASNSRLSNTISTMAEKKNCPLLPSSDTINSKLWI